ncbi:hypothetical protein WA026_018148 [Henosepilachna vigintioctopunctata]
MSPDLFKLSREFALASLEFHLARSVIIVVFSSIMINGEYMSRIWSYVQNKNVYESEILTSCIWLSTLSLITTSVDLPFDLYYTFILERSLGFNDITLKGFLRALILGLIITQIMSIGVVGIIVTVIQHVGHHVFIIIWLFLCIILSISISLAPLIKAPIPTSLIEFPQGNLKNKIETLCDGVGLHLKNVEMLLNNTSANEHEHVFFYGIFSQYLVVSAYILPIPHLQNKLSEQEILALIGHQLGHWFNNHILKKFVLSEVVLLIWFLLFFNIFEKEVIYQAFGFHDQRPIFVGILLSMQYIMMPYNLLTAFLLISLSRKFEYQADDFAIRLGMKQALRKALMGIYEVNIFKCPILDHLYSKCGFYQPSLLERLKHLGSTENV